MKLFFFAISLALICMVPAFAEPTVSDAGDVSTAILRTPDFIVDTSEFAETNQITIDVKFENDGTNGFHGIAWNTEVEYEGYKPDPDEVYEENHNYRKFFVYITDITKSDEVKLDREKFIVISDDDFIQINGKSKITNDFEIEVLDIDELVENSPFDPKSLIQTQLNLSSPELMLDNTYRIGVWTTSSHNSDGDVEFILSFDTQEQITTSDPTPAPMEMPSDIEEQMKLQQQKALEEHEQRKKQREAENNLRPENTGQDKPENIESKERTSQDMPDNTQRDTESQRPETTQNEKPENAGQAKPEYIPEPITDKPQCGTGTVLVNGHCQVIKTESVQEKGFMEWLMSIFGM